MNPDLDPWTKEFAEEFERKPYYDRDDPLPVDPLLFYEEAPMTILQVEDLVEFCKCGNRNEWILMGTGKDNAHYWGCTACRADAPPPLNKFDQLVDDLATGVISATTLQIAYRASIRQRKDLPEGIKDLLCGGSESHSGVLFQLFKAMQETIGSLELAYRRGEINKTDA